MNLQEALKVIGGGRVRSGEAVESACRSDRINAIMDAIEALARGDNIGRGNNVLKRVSRGSVILSVVRGGGGGGGGGGDTPFLVSATTKDNYTAIAVQTGMILNQVPYIDGKKMNELVPDGTGKLVQNTFTPPDIDFSVWLITRIKNSFDNYHPRIDIAEPGETDYVPVKPPEQSCYITATAPPLVDQIDFRIKWDAGATEYAGGFPIKLADVEMEAAPEGVTTGPVVKRITQYVFTNWRALIMVDKDLVPIG